jgi:hypothetical protein
MIGPRPKLRLRSMGTLRRFNRLHFPLLLLVTCVVNQGCMQRTTGYALHGQLRIGWCSVDQILRIDSQSLGRILSQRCVSAPLLPIAVHCDPSRGLASTVALQSLADEQLKVGIDGYELIADGAQVQARLESNSQGVPPISLPPRGAQMLVFNFANGTDARSGEIVLRGSVETIGGARQAFECRAHVTRSNGAWEWNNPFVAVD